MGIFGFLTRDRIEGENKTKPFHQNKSDAERDDWFARTRPWHKVDSGITSALIEIYGDNPMFEVFVVASMENNLVGEYAAIGERGVAADIACPMISGILFKQGAQSSSKVDIMLKSGNVNEKKLTKIYVNALNLLESSVIIEPNQIDAYVQLAGLKGVQNKNDEASEFVRQGLQAIGRIREGDAPFAKAAAGGWVAITCQADLLALKCRPFSDK